MAENEVDLSTGGTCVVVLSRDYQLESDFSFHRQILPLSVDQLAGTKEEIEKKIPPTTKVVVLSDGIPGFTYQNLHAVFRRRGLVYIQRKNQESINQELKKLFPEKARATTIASHQVSSNGDGEHKPKKIAGHGVIATLVAENVNLREANASEAKRLFRIAQEQGITTTIASLAQAIAKHRRKSGSTGVVKSAMSKQQQALAILDEAITNLGLIRDYVAETEQRNSDLEAKLETVAALFKK